MKMKVSVVGIVMLVTLLLTTLTVVSAKRGGEGGGRGDVDAPIIYVTEQGLYYDSIVTADPLPQRGLFQQLFPPFTNPDYPGFDGLSTKYGPGNPGHYFGGRWWVDITNDGIMNEGDHFFSCPLLGPGRESVDP